MSDYLTLQSSSGCSAATRGTHINCSSTIVVLMCEYILLNVLLEFGTVYRRASLVLSHYCRSEILWVMSTSVYIPNTDRFYFVFIIDVFSFYLTPNFVCYFYMHVSAEGCGM